MSDWEYSPIENIAYALIDIANTLERIEKLMPTPEGAITSTSTWSQTEPVAEEVIEPVEEELPEAEADDL